MNLFYLKNIYYHYLLSLLLGKKEYKSQGKLDKSYVDTNIEIKPETIFSTTTTRGTTPLYKSKPYYVDVNAKTLDWMELLETASKIKGPQLKRG